MIIDVPLPGDRWWWCFRSNTFSDEWRACAFKRLESVKYQNMVGASGGERGWVGVDSGAEVRDDGVCCGFAV